MLRKNVVYFGLLQGAEYLAPFLAIPIMARTLGTAEYGKIALTQAILAYFILTVEFGFNYTATRDAARSSDDNRKLQLLFGEIFGAKLILFVLTSIAAILLTIFLHKTLGILLLIAQLSALANVFSPIWLLQGIERVGPAALISSSIKFSALGIVFIISKTDPRIESFAAVIFGFNLLSSIALLIYTHRRYKITSLKFSPRKSFKRLTREKSAFFSSAASSFYRSSNSIILGMTASMGSVGIYSICEKVVRVAQELNRPIAMATYPRLSSKLDKNTNCFQLAIFRRTFFAFLLIGAGSSASLFLFADKIFIFLTGSISDEALLSLKIMSAAPLIASINLILGVQVMHSINQSSQFAKMVFAAGSFSFLLIGPMSYFFFATGAAITYIASELLLLVQLAAFHNRRRAAYEKTT